MSERGNTMRFLPEDEVGVRRATGLAIAPDGSAGVYAVEEADLLRGERSSRLWRWSEGVERPLTTGSGRQRFPVWSPDGRSLAFVAAGPGGDELMCVGAEGGRPRRVLGPESGFVAGDIFSARSGVPGFTWAPDSRSIACQLRVGPAVPGELGVEGPRATGDPMVTTEITERLRGGPAVRLVAIDLTGGEQTELARSERPLSPLNWAAGGLYAVERRPGETGGSSRFRLLRCVPGGAPVTVTEFEGASFTAVPSPDGRRFAVSGAEGTTHAPSPFLSILGADGTVERRLSSDDLTAYSDLAWCSGDALVAIADSGTRRRLVRIDLDSGRQQALTEGSRWVERLAASADGGTLAFLASTPGNPGEVYRLSSEGGQPEQLSNLNPHLGSYELGSGETIRWQAPDGAEIEGVLILPPGRQDGQRVPLVLDYHGGPAAHVGLGWNGLRQVLASAGYAVLAPNFRGGTGYGAASSEMLRGDLGGVPLTDSLAGIDHLVAEGIADPSHLFVYGHSWGGYMTNWTVTQTDRFRAAVSSGSVADLVSAFYTRYSSDVWFWRLRGTPLDALDAYRRWSPIFSSDRVTTPVLFLNGAEDRTTPPTQGLEMFTALRHQNVPAEYVLYPREGHGITEPAHQIDRLSRILAWFARYDGEEG